MKKIFALAAFAVLVFACTKEDPLVLTLPETSFERSASADTIEVKVETNGSYTVAVDQASKQWMEIKEAGTLTLSTVHIIVAENTERTSREGKLTVSNSNTSIPVTVTQSAADAVIEVDGQTDYSASCYGETITIKIKHNGTVSVRTTDDWIKQVETKGVVTDSYRFEIAENKTKAQRAGVIVFKDADAVASAVCKITQKGPNIAPANAPVKSGYNLRGVVKEEGTGFALKGVVVSDGYSCTTTDTLGCFYLNSDPTKYWHVFVSTPAEYENNFHLTNGLWKTWQYQQTASSPSYNFTLTPKKAEDVDKCRLLMLGDPQRMSSRQHSIDSWIYVCGKLADYKKAYNTTVNGPLYQMLLGDMVVNEMEVKGRADDFKQVLATSGVNTFTLAGNHDHYQNASSYENAIEYYAQYFGPFNYSFNLAGFHFIVFDDCNWTTGNNYSQSLNARAITFLKEDMKYVPEGKPVMICMHCPMTKKYGGNIPSTGASGYSALMSVLKGREAYFWYGHIHFGYFYKYTDAEMSKYASGVKSLYSNTVSRAGGAWCCSGEVCRDGTPRGWVELDLNGTDAKWQFHTIETNYDDMIHFYYPGQFTGDTDEQGNPITYKDDAALYCNVYLWSPSWTTPEFWSDGKKVGNFTRVTCSEYEAERDPYYSHLFYTWWFQGIQGFRYNEERPKNYDNAHLFKLTPPAGVTSGEIRVSDPWGRQYTLPVKW